jgi:hypothetical protein
MRSVGRSRGQHRCKTAFVIRRCPHDFFLHVGTVPGSLIRVTHPGAVNAPQPGFVSPQATPHSTSTAAAIFEKGGKEEVTTPLSLESATHASATATPTPK